MEKTEQEALDAAVEYYLALEGPWKAWVEDKLENFKPGEILTRDEDVLDTWFSSALWPFSTLGWPDETPELKTYYQTDVLVTGFDIIFFWVARMMMMGLHFMDEEPFHTVYVHALVRDKNGAKMSKSKGNVIDPLELIDEYGADALRFTLTIMAAQGRDVKLDPARIAGYRNFGTKLWNATRFAEMNGVARNDEFWLNDAKLTVNRWILTELTRAAQDITDGITSYSFNEAGACGLSLRLELFLRLVCRAAEAGFHGRRRGGQGREPGRDGLRARRDLQAAAPDHAVHDGRAVGRRRRARARAASTLLCHAAWPAPDFEDAGRGSRDQLADRPGFRHPLGALGDERAAVGHRAAGAGRRECRDEASALRATKRRSSGSLASARSAMRMRRPPASAQFVIGEATACLPLGTLIDLKAEAARLQKELAKVTEEIARLHKKLSNEKFVANAPEEVVAAEREKLDEYREAQAKLDTALSRVRSES